MLGLDWGGVGGTTATPMSLVTLSPASAGGALRFLVVLGIAGGILDGSTGDLAILVLLLARVSRSGSAAFSLADLAGGALAGGLSTAMPNCVLLDLVARPVVVAGVVSVTLSVVLESGVALAFPGGFARVSFTGLEMAEWPPCRLPDTLLVCTACATVWLWFPLPVCWVALLNMFMEILGRRSDGKLSFPTMVIFASTAGSSGSSGAC
jgi:hypothetical protein